MSEPTKCDLAQVAHCLEKFRHIETKLDLMHEDMQKLSQRVMNGLTDRINQHDHHITVIQERMAMDTQLRERQMARKGRWEAALISVCMTALVGTAYFLARMYFLHKTP